MLLSEFENLTDIKPDSILYSVIEKEYNAQTDDGKDVWDSKAQFCHAYKFDEDGLAEKCQRLANEEIWRREEQHRTSQEKSDNRIHGLFNETQALRKELADAVAANAELERENQRLKEDDETACKTLREMMSDNRIHGLFNENQLLRKEVEDQIAKRSQLEADKQELEREFENQRQLMQELHNDKRRADMFRILEQYVRDDVDMADIGRAVVAYVDLLDWEACHGND